jgi:iron complex transport system permease protein
LSTLLKKRPRLLTALLWITPVVIAVLCMGTGRFSLGLERTIEVLFSPFTGEAVTAMEKSVVFNIRLPRIFLAVGCGAALSASGLAFQSLFNNPLATPDTLGVASGASCGAVIALMLRMNLIGVQLVALVVGLAAVGLTWTVSKIRRQNSIIMIVLSGMVVAALFEAFVSLLKYVADPEEVLPTITYWLMGSLSNSSYKSLALGMPAIVIGVIIIFMLRWRLNILSLNEDEAKSMGINLRIMRLAVIVAATMMTASCVSMCGKIGWVGLLIPHIARMLRGGNSQRTIPACISLGASFTLLIDTLSRSMTAAEIPVSILTAIVGAPIFISLLRKTGGVASQ